MEKLWYEKNNKKVYLTNEQEIEYRNCLEKGKLSQEFIKEVGTHVYSEFTYKAKNEKGFFEDIEVEKTDMMLQKDFPKLEDYLVYVDKNGKYYIDEGNEYTYFIEYNELFIPLIPLIGKVLEIINSKYNLNIVDNSRM